MKQDCKTKSPLENMFPSLSPAQKRRQLVSSLSLTCCFAFLFACSKAKGGKSKDATYLLLWLLCISVCEKYAILVQTWASKVAKSSVQITLWRNIPPERILDALFGESEKGPQKGSQKGPMFGVNPEQGLGIRPFFGDPNGASIFTPLLLPRTPSPHLLRSYHNQNGR